MSADSGGGQIRCPMHPHAAAPMPYRRVRENGRTKCVLSPPNSYQILAISIQFKSPLEGASSKLEFEGESQDTCTDGKQGTSRESLRVSVERARLEWNECEFVSICAPLC